MSEATTTAPADEARSVALLERLVESATQAMELAGVHIGLKLGLYRALADQPATSTALAEQLDLDERYVREWLEHQAVAGVLDVDADPGGPSDRVFSLPNAHRRVLAERDDSYYLAPLGQLVVGALAPIDQLLDAFRTGAGVPYPDYGHDTRQGIACMNRPMFINELGTNWLPLVTDVHERLTSGPARVADIGCGSGWSSISIAKAYPQATVHGFDADHRSVEGARQNAVAEGVSDRVHFFHVDASSQLPDEEYDLVTIFEAIHDMAQPVPALRAARALAGGNAVIVADERVAEEFVAPGDITERLMYGFSVLHCLPVGREDEHSAATGTVMRPSTLRAYATEAGFSDVEILPIENDFWRFYRLVS
jgi:precorrin-6B methylase 2